MSYELVISPTAIKSLDELLARHRSATLLRDVATVLADLAESPSRFRQERRFGRPFVLVNHSDGMGLDITLRAYYRFSQDEKSIEILEIAPLMM